MPRSPRGAGPRPRATGLLTALTCTLVALAVGMPAATAVSPAASPAVAKKDETTVVVPADAPTTFRIASFNLLGAGHTAPGGNKKGWASGSTRMGWSLEAIAQERASIVGFQEMETPQFKVFKKAAQLDGYGWYPGLSQGRKALANTIMWRQDTWRLVEARLLVVPYFHGQAKPMPYVKLRNVNNGTTIWVYNSHNPADVRGPAKKWRDVGFRREAALVNQLRTAEPDVPVFITGDKNDRTNYFCQVARLTPVVAPNQAGLSGRTCYTKDIKIDWVLATPDVTFTSYLRRRDKLIQKATDHPMVVSTALLPSAKVAESGVDNVVIVDLEGLTRRWATQAPADSRLSALITRGASTMNARTDPDSVDRLANVASMLSGRPTDPAYGGTGLTVPSFKGTVHTSAGEYVSTMFDRAHNFGKSTALLATFPEANTIVSSYDSVNGGLDPFGFDNGKDKFDTAVVSATDGQTTKAAVSTFSNSAVNLSYVHLGMLSRVGLVHGFSSAEYKQALALTDRRLARILNAVNANPAMKGRTMVIVTADRGNTRVLDGSGSAATRPAAYRVPLIVWGPGVTAGTNLYDTNPGFTNPGGAQVDDSAAQPPIRVGTIANLVTKMLVQPALPGSTIDPTQSFTVLAP